MKDKVLQMRVSVEELRKLDEIANGRSRSRTIMDMIRREYDERTHSDYVEEFSSYPKEIQEVLNKYASGDGYDHIERSVMIFRFFESYFK